MQLIVAVENEEVPRLQSLYDRGRENGVADLRLLDSRQLRDIEPHCTVRERAYILYGKDFPTTHGLQY